jgi:meckelin
MSKLVFLIMDVWSGIMFWIIFFIAGYWFVTYKLQGNAYLLLPSVDNWGTTYLIFDIIFGLVIGLRFLSILYLVIEQSNVDIFLIDWERQPKLESIKSRTINGEEELKKDNIIIWRSLFLANEWNEIQTEYRYVRPETTLIWFIFFIKGLGWEQLAQANPDISTTSSELAPTNFILKFFLSAFIFLCIMAVQSFVELLNGYFFSLKF